MTVLAEQWRSVARVLRHHADTLDAYATDAEQVGDALGPEVVKLLSEIDGLLGLSIYRKEGPDDSQWLADARLLRSRISHTLARLGGGR